MDTDGVIVTTHAYHAGSLVKDIDTKLYEELISIEYASSAVVILGYKRDQIANKLDGFGFVVPNVENSNL
ncbi:MAG: protoporphyrinogen oxidase, partial [Nitrosopumilaceae archaeon]|nr:protoporphyrinogen oxidase [Nitrosopumilaceae archaeon]